jgi:hypothetical protein
MIALRTITADSAGEANGAGGGIFGPRARPDHSCSHPAFTPERDLYAEGAKERLRPPQAPGERPRAFCPTCTCRELFASALRTQTQEI